MRMVGLGTERARIDRPTKKLEKNKMSYRYIVGARFSEFEVMGKLNRYCSSTSARQVHEQIDIAQQNFENFLAG
jgi:hypothetical protein